MFAGRARRATIDAAVAGDAIPANGAAADVRVMAKRGRPSEEDGKGDNVTIKDRGNTTEYIREQPANSGLLAQLIVGLCTTATAALGTKKAPTLSGLKEILRSADSANRSAGR
jgi:hypothetical protein